MEVKKAVILAGGLGTRFLPLSKVVPKELWPLVDEPVIQKIISEAKDSGIFEMVFVLSPGEKKLLDYIKPDLKIEKVLEERGKDKLLNQFRKDQSFFQNIDFSYVTQREPLGDGHAVLQAVKKIKDEAVACLFADDIVDSKTPCLTQLMNVFKTCQKPVIALYRLPQDKISSYGVVKVEKIANRVYKIKEIVEKPKPGTAPSDLAVIGKYILTSEVFDYLKKAKPSQERKEIILADVFGEMLQQGKVIYGYEVEGKWLECGNKLAWLKSHLYLSLKDPRFGEDLKKFLKEIK